MQRVTISFESMQADRLGNLLPGTYLLPEQVVREIRERERSSGFWIIDNAEPLSSTRFTAEPREMLIWNTGQIGDQLYMTALVRALKKKMPQCAIDVVVTTEVADVWTHNKDVRALRYQFIESGILDFYDAYFIIDEDVANLTGSDQPNAYEFIFGLAGLEYNGELPVLSLSSSERLRAFTKVSGVNVGGERQVGMSYIVLGLHASRSSRNISPEQWLEIAQGLYEQGKEVEGFTIYSLANNRAGHEIQKVLNEIPGHVPLFSSLSIREIACLVREAFCVISVDSALVHIAAAVNTPCVAIMTTVPPSARTKHYPLTLSLWAENACAYSGCSWKGDGFRTQFGDRSLIAPCYTPERKYCKTGEVIKAAHILPLVNTAMNAKIAFDNYDINNLPILQP